MPEMLTVAQALNKMKEQYPNTPINSHSIRIWIKEDKIHTVTIGRRILISWDSIVDFLSGRK